MQRFASPFSARLKMAAVSVIYVGCPAYFFLWPLLTRRVPAHTGLLWGLVVILPFFFLPALYGALGVIEAASVYLLDDEGITKRGLRGETRLRWRDLSAYQVSSSKQVVTLTDSSGQRLNVVLGSQVTGYRYRDAQGQPIHEALNARLLPLQAQMQQRAQQGQTFGYGLKSPFGIVVTVLPAIALLMAIAFWNMSGTPELSQTQHLAMSGVPLLLGLALAWMGLSILLKRITITDTGIVETSPWRTRRLLFAQITGFAIRIRKGNNSSVEIVTLSDGSQTIRFTSGLPDYALLMDFVRARIAPDVLANEKAAVADEEQREARQMIWQWPQVGLILAVLLGMLAWLFLSQGSEKLADDRAFAARGQAATGRVIEKHLKGRSDPRCYVAFALEVNGRTYKSASYVPEPVYDRAQVGQSIPVIYLPDNPAKSRASASLGRQNAEDLVHTGHILLMVACALPFVLGAGAFAHYRWKYSASASTRRLERTLPE